MSVQAGVFSGVRVIELAQYVFVPGCSVLMADHGAEVIKVENPGGGDPYRSLQIGDGRETGAVNLAMEQNNRGKKSVALDLKSEPGRLALLRLIETADVFVTSLRPRALRALRLDVEDLRAVNPKLIYARGNGLGFRGAEADKPGFDASSFWARGGACDAFTRPGAEPTPPRPAFGDHAGSLSLAMGIAGALFKRAMTGEPTVVETSLLATATWLLSSDVTYSQVPGYKVHREGTPDPLKHCYETLDGRRIQLMLLDPRPHWAPLCRLVGLEAMIEDPRFETSQARMSHARLLIEALQERIGARSWGDHWAARFEAWDAPWELIRSVQELASDPQVRANEMVFEMNVGTRNIRVVSGPTGFDGHAAPREVHCAPELGQHTDELLGQVGYSAADIAALKERRSAQ
jgi:crotonobetainyl-CoA:carnitine CoA-transferase CaiB-like acyl-CoA transferase